MIKIATFPVSFFSFIPQYHVAIRKRGEISVYSEGKLLIRDDIRFVGQKRDDKESDEKGDSRKGCYDKEARGGNDKEDIAVDEEVTIKSGKKVTRTNLD